MKHTAKILGALALFAAPALANAPAAAQIQLAPIPKADEAMTAICGSSARDARCLLDGREMTYWIGFQSIVEGRYWYTVIATASAHLASDDSADTDTSTPDKLRISQVTYEAANGRWKQLARQTGFGSIYANNSGNPSSLADTGGHLFAREIPGSALIGYPVAQMANEGITLHGHAMFRSAPDKSGRWVYAGDILSGSDNAASGCEDKDAPQACYSSNTDLTLTGRSAGSWPEIKADLSGTVVGMNGKVRPARPADAQVWHFDASQGAYTTDPSR